MKIHSIFFFIFFLLNCLSAQENEDLKKDKEKSPHRFSGTLTLITDYRDRGISQTMRQPAVQGEFRYEHTSGFYAKTWASNVDGTSNFINNASLEWDFYLGYKWNIPKTAIEVDTGCEFYWYPGGESFVRKRTSYNSLEYYIQLTYKKINFVFHQIVTDYFGINSNNPPFNWAKKKPVHPNGHSLGSPYFELNWEIPLYQKTTLTLHTGYQCVINYPQLSFFDWLIMLTYRFEWFDVTLTTVGTNAKKDFYNVPNHLYHSHKRIPLGTPGINLGITKKF